MDTPDLTAPTIIDVTGLPPEVVAQLRLLVQTLRDTTTSRQPLRPRKSLMGAYSHLKTGSWSAEDFKAARREMFGGAQPEPYQPPPSPPAES